MRSRSTVAVIQHKASLPDHFTGVGDEWTTFAEVFPDLRPLRGREQFNAAQVQSNVTHIVETELVDDVKSGMRLRIPRDQVANEDEPEDDANFRFFEIESVVNVNEANRSMELMVVESG